MRKLFSWITIILPGIMIPVIPGLIEAQPCMSQEETANIQKQLKSEDVILDYYLTDSSAMVWAITGDSTMHTCQTLNPLFWMAHKSFRKKIKSAEPMGYAIAGQILYLFLIKPIQDFITGKHRLIIKRDDLLSELPFEAIILPTQKSDSGHGHFPIHYLIQDFEVIYGCKQFIRNDFVTDFEEEIFMPTERQFAFIGFSPVFYDRPGLSALPDSKNEINEIGSLFKQRGMTSWLVFEQNSLKEYFKSVACKGKIVHLSTHYLPEKSEHHDGGLLFWDYNPDIDKEEQNIGVLTMDEIDGLHLQADLIVINACASGLEKLKSGKVTNSVPAMFLKAGAKNILTTLWNVTDRLAGDFMVRFYRLWLSGKTYSQALREVKLQMISRPETSLPTVWAPYVLTSR